MLQAIRPRGGIYLIVNLVNGNMYIGSAITGNMGNRFHKHLFALSGSSMVGAAVTKYGLAQFALILLETIEEVITQVTHSDLLVLEDYYIKLLDPAYNIAPQAGNTFGMKHTEETKKAMRANDSTER